MFLAMVEFCQNWKHPFHTVKPWEKFHDRHFEAQIFHVKMFDTCFASSLIIWPEKWFITGQNSQVWFFFSIWGLCPCIWDDILPHLYLLHPGECPYSINYDYLYYYVNLLPLHCTFVHREYVVFFPSLNGVLNSWFWLVWCFSCAHDGFILTFGTASFTCITCNSKNYVTSKLWVQK